MEETKRLQTIHNAQSPDAGDSNEDGGGGVGEKIDFHRKRQIAERESKVVKVVAREDALEWAGSESKHKLCRSSPQPTRAIDEWPRSVEVHPLESAGGERK